MLVLTRNAGEEIQIGDNIRIRVTSISGGRVRLGIDAPDDMTIGRGDSDAGSPRDTPDDPPPLVGSGEIECTEQATLAA